MKRLAARSPCLDIFTSGYVLREDSGWLITDLGRQFLVSIEAPVFEPAIEPAAAKVVAAVASDLPENILQLADHKAKRLRRAAA